MIETEKINKSKMKNMNRTKKIKTRIIDRRKLIDAETGEEIDCTLIQREGTVDTNFYKIWLYDTLQVLDLLGSKKIKIVSHILKNMNKYDNSFSMTFKEIADELKVSKGLISEVIDKLIESNFMKKERVAHYKINPNLIWKGHSGTRNTLLIKYDSIETKENKSEKSEIEKAVENIEEASKKAV